MKSLPTSGSQPRSYALFRGVLSWSLISIGLNASGQCGGLNAVENGDFNDVEGENVTASGWGGISTPDINDEFGPVNTSDGYDWIVQPDASPNGGSWQSLTGSEGVAQFVPTSIGIGYTLCFYYARHGIASGNTFIYDDPFNVVVKVDNDTVLITYVDTSLTGWELACVPFIATTTNTRIDLLGHGEGPCYGAVDGACVASAIGTQVTEPYTGLQSASLYPNPATSSIVRVLDGTIVSSVTAVDGTGRSIDLHSDGRSIDISSLSAGIYSLMYMTSANHSPRVTRLIVEMK